MPADTSDTAGLLNRRFVTLLGVMFFAGAFTAPYDALLPAYVKSQLELPPRFTGILSAVPMIVSGVFFVVSGAVADTFGYRRTLLIGIAAWGGCGLVFLTSFPPLLFAAAFFIGCGFAMKTVGSQSYLMRVTASPRLGLGSAFFFIGFTLGGSTGNWVFGQVADEWGYRTTGFAMATGLAVVVVAGLALLPSVGMPVGEQRRTLRAGFAGYGGMLCRSRVRWLLAVRFLPTCAWGAATVAYPYLLFDATRLNQEPANFVAASLVVAACAQIVTGRVCDRFGVRWPIRIAPVAMLVACVLTAASADSIWGLWVFGIMLTASAWSLSTTMPALMNTMSSVHERGRIVGAAHVAWALGMATGRFGAGWLLEVDHAACYIAGSLFCAATVVCAWMVVRPQLERFRP